MVIATNIQLRNLFSTMCMAILAVMVIITQGSPLTMTNASKSLHELTWPDKLSQGQFKDFTILEELPSTSVDTNGYAHLLFFSDKNKIVSVKTLDMPEGVTDCLLGSLILVHGMKDGPLFTDEDVVVAVRVDADGKVTEAFPFGKTHPLFKHEYYVYDTKGIFVPTKVLISYTALTLEFVRRHVLDLNAFQHSVPPHCQKFVIKGRRKSSEEYTIVLSEQKINSHSYHGGYSLDRGCFHKYYVKSLKNAVYDTLITSFGTDQTFQLKRQLTIMATENPSLGKYFPEQDTPQAWFSFFIGVLGPIRNENTYAVYLKYTMLSDILKLDPTKAIY